MLPPLPWVLSAPLCLLTFVVERTVKIVAARVEAGGQLDEVASPRVAGAWEAGQGDELLGLGWEEPSVHAAVVCKRQDTVRGRRSPSGRDQHVQPHPHHFPALHDPVHTIELLRGCFLIFKRRKAVPRHRIDARVTSAHG